MAGGLRAGVVGVGAMGRMHAAKYASLPGVELTAVADLIAERAAGVAARHGTRGCATLEELLPHVDVVSIAVPTAAHYAVARACLDAGVHVLVEKPIAGTVAEGDDLVATAQARGLCLAVGHLERFNPAYVGLAQEVAQPVFVQAERLARFQPRGTDVDVVLDLMIHDIDLVLALMGSPVAAVSACGFRVMTGKIDIANAYLEFENGGVASLSASRISREPVRKLRAFGNEVYASADLHAGRLRVERAGTLGQPSLQDADQADALGAEIAAFVAGVRGVSHRYVSGREAREALVLALRVNEAIAARAGRRNAAGPR